MNSNICIRCQKCCKVMYVPIMIDQDLWQLLMTRGFTVYTFDGRTYLEIDQTCKHLTKNGCDMYELRPKACSDYDGRFDPFLSKECMLGEHDAD